jgi:hypothetical protein
MVPALYISGKHYVSHIDHAHVLLRALQQGLAGKPIRFLPLLREQLDMASFAFLLTAA